MTSGVVHNENCGRSHVSGPLPVSVSVYDMGMPMSMDMDMHMSMHSWAVRVTHK